MKSYKMNDGTLIFIIFIVVILILLAFGVFIWFFVIKPQEKKSCKSNTDCLNDEYCNSDGKCVDYGVCTDSNDCFEDQKCHLGKCVQCVSNSDCSNYPGKPVCSHNNLCSQCNTSSDCASGVCDTSIGNGTCVTCLSNSDCSSGRPICDQFKDSVKNHCVSCLTNSDCSNGKVCTNGSCVTQSTYADLPVTVEQETPSFPPKMPPIMRTETNLKPIKEYKSRCQACF